MYVHVCMYKTFPFFFTHGARALSRAREPSPCAPCAPCAPVYPTLPSCAKSSAMKSIAKGRSLGVMPGESFEAVRLRNCGDAPAGPGLAQGCIGVLLGPWCSVRCLRGPRQGVSRRYLRRQPFMNVLTSPHARCLRLAYAYA